nr:islet amyloid polypeptide [Kogia breviceps]
MEKRKCNTATCATREALINFLVWSSNSFGAIFSPNKVGSNIYGKRNTVEILKREPLNYLLPLEETQPLPIREETKYELPGTRSSEKRKEIKCEFPGIRSSDSQEQAPEGPRRAAPSPGL